MAQWRLLTRADHDNIRHVATELHPLLAYLLPIAPCDQNGVFYDHGRGGKLPRNNAWRPYRLTLRNAMLAVVALCYSREDNCVDVEVCVAADPPWLVPGEAWRAAVLFILSEAYKTGGTMAVRFRCRPADAARRPLEAGVFPEALRALANEHQVPLAHADEGYLTPDESKRLYFALTPLPDDLRQMLQELAATGAVSLTRICYLLHRGVWNRAELEVLLRGSRYPEQAIAAGLQPEHRHIYRGALDDARRAVLAGLLVRALSRPARQADQGRLLELSDCERELSVRFVPELSACEISSKQRLKLVDWQVKLPLNGNSHSTFLEPEKPLVVLLRTAVGRRFVDQMVQDAERLDAYLSRRADRPLISVLAPFDVVESDAAQLARLAELWQPQHVELWRTPDALAAIDQVATGKLAQTARVH